jgi:m7GpppX diphosphatase
MHPGPAAPTSLDKLNEFNFERVINEDPATHSLILLGTLPATHGELEGTRVKAIIRIEKTALAPDQAKSFFSGESPLVERVELEESTDIVRIPFTALNTYDRWSIKYTWLFGWLGDERERDVKINVICPATEVHVRKVSTIVKIL